MFRLVLLLIHFIGFNADVSHVKNHNPYSSFNGYNYNPPLHQLPSPAPNPPQIPTTFIPEIIVNKDPSNGYLPPPVPSETESPIVIHPSDEVDMGAYLPPFNEEIPPSQGYLPPDQLPENQYLPPQSDEPSDSGYQYSKPKQPKSLRNSNFNTNSKSNALHLSVNSLQCLDGIGGYFHGTISVHSFIENLPIVDLDAIDPRCEFHLSGVRMTLSVPINDFQRCGIIACGDRELCVNVRFPQIFGMKSLDDSLLTLKCKLQDRVVSKTHAVRFGVSQAGQARNSVVFVHKKPKQNLRTQLGLYRQSGSGFTRSLDSGGYVQLGEELLLRAQVKYGDGWNHSRVSDVSLQRVSPNGDVLNSSELIKSNGCINPQMHSVSSVPPVFEPPLGYRFGFKAVMFQGMKSGDEMVMNVRIIGCMDSHDCQLDHVSCANDPVVSSNRIRRQTQSDNKTDSDAMVEVSNISFRVMMPSEYMATHESINHTNVNAKGEIVLFTTIGIIAFLILAVLIVLKQKTQRPYFVWDKY